jgi:hypothetical protein
LGSELSRADWEGTWPKTRTADEMQATNDWIKSLSDYTPNRTETTTTNKTTSALIANAEDTTTSEETSEE